MYDGSFGLNRRPFAPVPQADQYFPASTIESARTTLARCIQRGEGAGLVVGPSGTGKTLLCVLLAEQFRRSFQVAMLASGRLGTRRALFQAILYELGRPYRYMDAGELRLAIVEYLTAGEASSRGLLLLVDEAHTLPLHLLEEIRLLSNLVRDGQPLVRLVLVGGAVLEERFASPKLDSFSQRLSARCYLEAFNRTETQEYIQWQIDSAGGLGDHVFPEATCQNVFQATGGVPRLVNQVCDHALLLAYVAGQRMIDPANIEEAWSDLQQLPTPWNAEPKSDPSNGVVEFGSLDDSPESAHDASSGSATVARVFRVASVEEEEAAEADDSTPSGQIHRIEQLLVEADGDFEPAGSIGPEIELCFEDADHPFQEKFEHEELVLDRYAAKGPTPKPPETPATLPATAVEATVPVFVSTEMEPSPLAPPETRSECPPSPALPADATTAVEEVLAEVAVLQQEVLGGDCPGLRVSENGTVPFDAPLPAPNQPAPKTSPIAPPQRREYRRLFAQLLRG
jgi:type II secretory pathway predicted ATPase ExeA